MTPGNFVRPKGVAYDSDGNIWVADAAFNNFQIFDPSGHVRMFVGAPGTVWLLAVKCRHANPLFFVVAVPRLVNLDADDWRWWLARRLVLAESRPST